MDHREITIESKIAVACIVLSAFLLEPAKSCSDPLGTADTTAEGNSFIPVLDISTAGMAKTADCASHTHVRTALIGQKETKPTKNTTLTDREIGASLRFLCCLLLKLWLLLPGDSATDKPDLHG